MPPKACRNRRVAAASPGSNNVAVAGAHPQVATVGNGCEGKSAGVRTHLLVAMGSALFVLLPNQMGMDIADLSRVVQGVVAGVGFLCAGTILKDNATGGDEHVQGLTTAAGLWLTAAIGMACGLGREVTAIMSALLALAVFALIPRLVIPRAAANTDTDAHKAPAADRPG